MLVDLVQADVVLAVAGVVELRHYGVKRWGKLENWRGNSCETGLDGSRKEKSKVKLRAV